MPTDQPPEPPDAGELAPEARPTRDIPAARPPRSVIVEEALSVFAQSSGRDPFLDKLTAKQIDRTLEIQAKREENSHELRMASQKAGAAFSNKVLALAAFAVACLILLFWLFLHYGKTDQVFNLIAILATGGGGVGIGVGLKRRNDLASAAQFDPLRDE